MKDEVIHSLQKTTAEVAVLNRTQRENRVNQLIDRALEIEETSIQIYAQSHRIVARVILYSGGDDSTALAHLFKGRADYAAHANTTIGVEETRQFVRDTCAQWNLPLIEKFPPVSYEALILERGFPGPGQHYKMYQRLKERCLRQVRADLVKDPRKERVLFLAGRRRDESKRRADIPLYERTGSTIWVSPLAEWTKLDLNAYRLMHGNVPRNPVSATLHMSGECLCGSFAKRGEFEEIANWYPGAANEIRRLESLLVDREDIPSHRRLWGWGVYKDWPVEKLQAQRMGPLCSSCAIVEKVDE